MGRAQTVDQAGFRSGFACDDHLLAVTLLIEICNEHNIPLWLCTVDYEKAFDSIEHGFLWQALLEQGVPAPYINLLASMYSGQCGKVSGGGALSREYSIQRGTKQGDPLSPVLFNAALGKILEPLQTKWQAKGWGVDVVNKNGCRLTNLRFADDILLIASSKRQLQHMIDDLVLAAGEAGLSIHMGKTKVLSNDPANQGGSLKLERGAAEMMPFNGSTAYLGKQLSCHEIHDMKLSARLDKAWKKFFLLKTDLCGRHVSLQARLKLFNASVTSTVLYGSGTWTMTADRERKLRTTQRRMLRWMLGSHWRRPREQSDQSSSSSGSDTDGSEPEETEEDQKGTTDKKQEESWVDWIQRCTRIVEHQLGKAGVDDWVAAQRRRKWRLAGHTARRQDGRWSETLLDWEPICGHRSRGHPPKRWTNDLDAFFFHLDGVPRWIWKATAQDREKWQVLEDSFVERRWYK